MAQTLLDRALDLKAKGLLSFHGQDSEAFMNYAGTLEESLAYISEALKYPGTDQSGLTLFLYASRPLIGITDYALSTKKPVLQKKYGLTHLAEDIARGDYDSARDLLRHLKFHAGELRAPVIEEADPVSWCAFDPDASDSLLSKLKRHAERKHFTFDYLVLDGHDGYRPGLMLAPELHADIIPLRSSMDSGRDPFPRLIEGEGLYVAELLERSNVAIIGEDVSTGKTLYFIRQLVERLANPRRIVTACALRIPAYGYKQTMEIDFFGKEQHVF